MRCTRERNYEHYYITSTKTLHFSADFFAIACNISYNLLHDFSTRIYTTKQNTNTTQQIKQITNKKSKHDVISMLTSGLRNSYKYSSFNISE